jgi:hypothetical protein
LLEAWHEAVSMPSIAQVLEDNGLGEPINQGGGGEGVQGELFGLQQEPQLVLAWIFHKGIEQRSGERVRRLEIIEPNENATHRFFDYRL